MKNKGSYGHMLVHLCAFILVIAMVHFNYWQWAAGLAVLLSVGMWILYNPTTPKSGMYSDCVKRINQNDLMFDIADMGVDSQSMMGRELEQLIVNLKSNFKEQVDISRKVNVIADQLTHIAKELGVTMESVASSTEITSENSEKQFMMLQEMKTSIESIVETIRSLNEEMDETASYASQTIASVKTGIHETAQIQDKMATIKELFNSIHKKISVIKDNSEEVINLNSLVHSIADQTSLLALNASIEAARAGEHGKGFAVVASEVSKLSAETNTVSKKIEDVISTLQDDLIYIVKSIEEESVYVDESYDIVIKTISDFNAIQESLNSSMKKIDDMRNAIQEVSSSGENIASNVLEITSFSEEITSQMQEATAQVQVQNQETSTLREVTDTLVESADQMLQNVANKVMEGKMLEAVRKIKVDLAGKHITNDTLDPYTKKLGVDVVYITDTNGIVRYCTERETVGLNLFEIDPTYAVLRRNEAEFIATPIKRRVEDNKLFKFLSIMDDGIVYQVGMALNSIVNF